MANEEFRPIHPATTVSTTAPYAAPVRRISWGAVFAGAAVALVTYLTLNLAGLAIGAANVDPVKEADPMGGMAMGTGIWIGVSSLVALFLGGMIASRLAGIRRHIDGMLQGIVVWSVVTILMLALVTTTLTSMLSGAAQMMGQGVQTAVQVAGQSRGTGGPGTYGYVEPQTQSQMQQIAQSIRQSAAKLAAAATNPQSTDEDFNRALNQFVTQIQTAPQQVDQQAMARQLAQRTGMSEQEAKQVVQGWVQQAEQTAAQLPRSTQEIQQQAEQVGQRTAETVSSAALWGFIAMLAGALAAGFGGWLGTPAPDRDEVRTTIGSPPPPTRPI